mgnify:CR=1 FL=1
MGYAPEAPKGGSGGGGAPPVWIFYQVFFGNKNGHETAKYGPYQAQNLRPRSCTLEYQFPDPRIYEIYKNIRNI